MTVLLFKHGFNVPLSTITPDPNLGQIAAMKLSAVLSFLAVATSVQGTAVPRQLNEIKAPAQVLTEKIACMTE